MVGTIVISCQCGALGAELRCVEPRRVNRGACYCRDCQAFAHHLGHADVLDSNGGTRLVQMRPGQFHLTRGADQLAALKLSENGILRWYAACCNTPLANTPSTPNMPFVGVLEACMRSPTTDPERDALLGRPGFKVFAGSATGEDRPPTTTGFAMLPVMVRMARIVIGASVGGERRNTAFRDDNAAPSVAPQLLTDSERTAAYTAAEHFTAGATAGPTTGATTGGTA